LILQNLVPALKLVAVEGSRYMKERNVDTILELAPGAGAAGVECDTVLFLARPTLAAAQVIAGQVRALTRRGGANQVPGAEVAVTQNIGGSGASVAPLLALRGSASDLSALPERSRALSSTAKVVAIMPAASVPASTNAATAALLARVSACVALPHALVSMRHSSRVVASTTSVACSVCGCSD
jgi:hypothetical protein